VKVPASGFVSTTAATTFTVGAARSRPASRRVSSRCTITLRTCMLASVSWDRSSLPWPLQDGGVTAFPGLCFVGLQWLRKRKSALFLGVGEDAARVASHLAAE